MKLDIFAKEYDLVNKTEIEKVALLAFYYLKTENKQDFDQSDIFHWFETINYTKPNMSRLVKGLARNKFFTKGKRKNSFRLHEKQIIIFESSINCLREEREDIEFVGEILPKSIFIKSRGYIENIAKQINAAYENNIFDGCAVLMRRLIEILLILTYQFTGQEMIIKSPSSQYRDLSVIIDDVNNNRSINLSKTSKDCLNLFRVLGNFSAHKIEYNCRREDIKTKALDYRALIEELLYKSGIRT